ncbi:hypothetical protein [Methanoregula sp.]|uniref:hypothetical protein n=1 Tax=Methanoregula sp. TaxID=2052170 RepID=UPI003C715AE3
MLKVCIEGGRANGECPAALRCGKKAGGVRTAAGSPAGPGIRVMADTSLSPQTNDHPSQQSDECVRISGHKLVTPRDRS